MSIFPVDVHVGSKIIDDDGMFMDWVVVLTHHWIYLTLLFRRFPFWRETHCDDG